MKFINLLKKELCELINKEMIISLAVVMVIFMAIGNVMETTISEVASEKYTVNICDCDDTEFTQELLGLLEKNEIGHKIVKYDTDDYAELLEKNNITSLVIIPNGFTDELLTQKKQGSLISISRMKSSAMTANISNSTGSSVEAIRSLVSTLLAMESDVSPEELAFIDAPVTTVEHTVVDDKSAAVSINDVMSKVSMQNMLLPIVVFVLIMMTSQSLMSSISNEKIDKTLETLLSAPVSRTSVITAKMLAAAVVALINAVVYMFGFSFFVTGGLEESASEAISAVAPQISVEAALARLGLSLGITDYLFIGLQLFLTIMICLSISIILGAMVNDTKSSQTMIMPIMMMAMIPYIVSMISDINTLPTVAKLIMYAIPFTHTFSAMSNLMFGNDMLFFGGLVYQVLVFIIFMFFALRLFNSDKIFTISLNLGQKSRFKKKKNTNNEE